MMRHRAILLAGALSGTLLIATARCASDNLPDPTTDGCTHARAAAALDSCGFELPGDIPKNSPCLGLPNASTAITAGNYDVRACQEEHAALWLTCITDNVAQCGYEADAGVPVSVADQCQYTTNPTAPTPDPTCKANCVMTRQTCDDACTTSSAQACLDCSFACGTALVKCVAACPATDGGM